MEVTIDLHGMEGIEKKLLELGEDWSKTAVRRALKPAGAILQGAMINAAPVKIDARYGGLLEPGELKADIRVEVKGGWSKWGRGQLPPAWRCG